MGFWPMLQSLRISRAVWYGAIAGAIFAAIGHLRAPDMPSGFDGWAYIVGGWTGCLLLGIFVFVMIAAICNLIVDGL